MLSTFGFLSGYEFMGILIIALIIFGPGKLPDIGKALGKTVNEFKAETNAGSKKPEVKAKAEVVEEEKTN